jgi:hypothetical protein
VNDESETTMNDVFAWRLLSFRPFNNWKPPSDNEWIIYRSPKSKLFCQRFFWYRSLSTKEFITWESRPRSFSTEAQYSNFDQCPGKPIWLSTKWSEIGMEIEESILLLIEILNSKFLTEFDKTPKVSHQLRNKKSRMTVRPNSKLQSLGAGSICVALVTWMRSSKRKMSLKTSSVSTDHKRFYIDQYSIWKNTSRDVQLNWFSIWHPRRSDRHSK